MIRKSEAERFSLTTSKAFNEVIAGVNAAIGHPDMAEFANYTKPLRVEKLAEVARMGMSTLHHHFRALTAMSPLQYQKQLRLVAARERMLVEGIDAASAAFEVGYESASQFIREYKRFFGQPPMRDIKVRRLAGSAMVSD